MTTEPSPPLSAPPTGPEVVRSEERLRVGTVRVPVGRVRLTRRVVTETRLVEVQLRREELHVEHLPATGREPVPAAGRDDLVLVLSREVPVVGVRAEPYERVRVRVVDVVTDQPVTAELRHEEVEVDLLPPAPPA